MNLDEMRSRAQEALDSTELMDPTDLARDVLALTTKVDELEAWSEVAVESNKAIAAYLKSVKPDLEPYGMPVDGVRIVVHRLTEELQRRLEQSEREKCPWPKAHLSDLAVRSDVLHWNGCWWTRRDAFLAEAKP